MKIIKQVITIIVAGIVIMSCGKQAATSYTIEGELEGIADSTKIELVEGATRKNEKPIAETVVLNGKFSFKGSTQEPRMFYIRVADSYGAKKLIVENGSIRLKGKVEKNTRRDKSSYNYDGVKVEGSPSNDLYLQKTAPRNTLDSLYKAYHDDNKEIFDAISKARQENNKDALDSLNNTDAAKKLSADEKAFFQNVGMTMKKIVMDNKDSWWGPLLMLDLMSYFTPEQKEWYESFSQEAKDSYYGQIVKKELFPEGFIGKELPAFKLTDKKNNKETTVAALGKNKKYILIDFWASWCAPCRKEIPNLKNLYKKYSSKGFEIISISIDAKEADWAKALNEENLPWPNYLDTGEAAGAFNVKAIPAMFLVDEKGIIIEDKLRGKELEAKLSELF